MEYGQIAGNKSLNEKIYHYFKYISGEDAKKFVNKFSSQDEEQVMHTFRELVLGAYLASNGFRKFFIFTSCEIHVDLIHFILEKINQMDQTMQGA